MLLRGGYSDAKDASLESVTGLYQSGETEAGMVEGGAVACAAVKYCSVLLGLYLATPAAPLRCWNVS